MNMSFSIPEDMAEEFDENTENKSEVLRSMVKGFNKYGHDHDVVEEVENFNPILLKTYRNAIMQNIQILQNQVDKIDEELEKYENDEDDEDEVILEIDLDIASKNL